jgi:hypothetical protein
MRIPAERYVAVGGKSWKDDDGPRRSTPILLAPTPTTVAAAPTPTTITIRGSFAAILIFLNQPSADFSRDLSQGEISWTPPQR